MLRIACLRIPRFQIVVHRRFEPELKGKPLVLIEGKSSAASRAKIALCSQEAERCDVHPGMRLSQSMSICPDVVWREYNSKLYADAQRKLVTELIACAPKVVAEQPGIFLLDASGLAHLGGETKFCLGVLKRASQSGYVDGCVGIADSAFAAMVASMSRRKRWLVVPAGKDAEFLAPLSIRYLPLSDELRRTLDVLGIATMGQLASLPAASVAYRFGDEGARVHDLARAIDPRRPSLPLPDKSYECGVELGGPIESINEISFVLKSMLDRLMSELHHEGLLAEELTMSLFNDDDLFDQRPVKLISPSSSTKFLLDVLRLSFESQPVRKEITGIKLAVSRHVKEAWDQGRLDLSAAGQAYKKGLKGDRAISRAPHAQAAAGDYWSARPVFSEGLMLLLQKLCTRFGEDTAVIALPGDQHFSEHAGAWVPVLNDRSTAALPLDLPFIQSRIGLCGLASGLVLRRFEKPVRTMVQFDGKDLRALTWQGRWCAIKMLTEPERLSGMWWDVPLRQTHYIALTDSVLLSLLHDHQQNNWFIEGLYD